MTAIGRVTLGVAQILIAGILVATFFGYDVGQNRVEAALLISAVMVGIFWVILWSEHEAKSVLLVVGLIAGLSMFAIVYPEWIKCACVFDVLALLFLAHINIGQVLFPDW